MRIASSVFGVAAASALLLNPSAQAVELTDSFLNFTATGGANIIDADLVEFSGPGSVSIVIPEADGEGDFTANYSLTFGSLNDALILEEITQNTLISNVILTPQQVASLAGMGVTAEFLVENAVTVPGTLEAVLGDLGGSAGFFVPGDTLTVRLEGGDATQLSLTDGEYVQVEEPVAVPVPGTLALMGAGLLGLAAARRRA